MSIVQELQKDALNPDVPVSQVLRKAVFIAKKLDLDDTEQWLMYERSGYPIGSQIPEYRSVPVSHIEAWNPYANQWVRALAPSPDIDYSKIRQKINQPLASLEDGANSTENLYAPVPDAKSDKGTDLRFVVNAGSIKIFLMQFVT